jgi:arylsulfatase A-like enzyme
MDYEPPLEHARLFDPEVEDESLGTHDALERYIKGIKPATPQLAAEEIRRVKALYDGEIHYTDAEIGRMLRTFERLGLMKNSIVVLTSDHGEEFGEHGSMEGHAWTLFDETTHVPLVMRFPDDRHAGVVVDTVVQLIDIAPTIVDAAGLATPAEFEGRSLLPIVRDQQVPALPTFSSVRRWNRKIAVRTATHKLIYTYDTKVNEFGVPIVPGFELYDVTRDPGEQHDQAAASPELRNALQALLFDWLNNEKNVPPEPVDVLPLTEQEEKRLRSLGYLQ